MYKGSEAHRAYQRAYSKAYYWNPENLERCRTNGRAYMKTYGAEHREERREYSKAYYATAAGKENNLAHKKKSRAKHGTKIKAWNVEYMRRRRAEKGSLVREQSNRSSVKLRNEMLAAYGNACACCGETAPAFLTIDHIHGGGTKHRASLPSKNVYAEIRREGFPKDKYRLLCMNCNFATRFGKKCPHQQAVDHLIASLDVVGVR